LQKLNPDLTVEISKRKVSFETSDEPFLKTVRELGIEVQEVDNFFKLPLSGFEPLTLGLQGQHSPPTPWGTHSIINIK